MNKELLDAFLKYLSEYYGGRPAPEVEYFPSNDVRVPVLDGVGSLSEDEFVQALNAGFGQMQPQMGMQPQLPQAMNQMGAPGPMMPPGSDGGLLN